VGVTPGKVKAARAHRFVLSPVRGGDAAARRRSVIDDECPVVGGVYGEDMQRGEMKGEVRRTVNLVHGAWGGDSLRKGSAAAFPHDSDGSPVTAMDEMQRGGTEGVVWLLGEGERRKGRKETTMMTRWPFYRGAVGSKGWEGRVSRPKPGHTEATKEGKGSPAPTSERAMVGIGPEPAGAGGRHAR
jgi:hypothetical protein